MLIFGVPRLYDTLRSQINYVLNFNSLVEGVPKLIALNPYWNINNQQIFADELSFDKWYINLITTNLQCFKEIMDIMRAVYNGYNVYILCDWCNDIAINMIEALIKFIADTYGYYSNIINDESDMLYLKEGTFSTTGIQLFDINMETYINIFGTRNLVSTHGDLA